MSKSSNTEPCFILDKLPIELRLMIWRRALPYHACKRHNDATSKRRDIPQLQWVSGSGAILRVNKQVYSEALPILYGEEVFVVQVQSRRAIIQFQPAGGAPHSTFGLMSSSTTIDTHNHPGLSLVRRWIVCFCYHTVGGKQNQALKCSGLKSFLDILPAKAVELIFATDGKQNTQFVWSQMISVFVSASIRASMRQSKTINLDTQFWKNLAFLITSTHNPYQPIMQVDKMKRSVTIGEVETVVKRGHELLDQQSSVSKGVPFVTSRVVSRKKKLQA